MLQKSNLLLIIGSVIFVIAFLLFASTIEDWTNFSSLYSLSTNLVPGMGETIAFPFESEEWNLSSIHIVIHAEPTDVPMLVKMNDDTKLISLEKKFQGYFNETISIDASKAALLNVKNQGDVNVALDVIVVDGDVVLDDVLMVNEVMQMSKILFVLSVIIVAIGMIMYFRNRKT